MLPCPLDELEELRSAAPLTLLVALLSPKVQSKPAVSCAVRERPLVFPKVALSLIMMVTVITSPDFGRARIGEEIGRPVFKNRTADRATRHPHLAHRRIGHRDEAAADRRHRRLDEKFGLFCAAAEGAVKSKSAAAQKR